MTGEDKSRENRSEESKDRVKVSGVGSNGNPKTK